MRERYQAMQDQVAGVLALAEKLYGVKILPKVEFNLRGRVAGWAGCRRCKVTRVARDFRLRFNCELIQGQHYEDMVNNTVPHEIAHLVCFARQDLGNNHDAGWQRVCLALGGDGSTKHNYEVTPRGGGFVYRASCGELVTVSRQIHNKIQMGQGRILKKTRGRVDRYCAWAPQSQPLPDVPQLRKIAEIAWGDPAEQERIVRSLVERVDVSPAGADTLSWAEKVRRLIGQFKTQGPEYVMRRAVDDLGMTRERARSCVKAHWDRIA
tara:strand:+ start:6992 stop:7789 length:798 start_codon:yes stop_codon:yes gene_type:complete